MELRLSAEEQALLADVLEQYHRELLNEIAHTDHREFKLRLRSKEELLEGLLCRLRATAAQPAAG